MNRSDIQTISPIKNKSICFYIKWIAETEILSEGMTLGEKHAARPRREISPRFIDEGELCLCGIFKHICGNRSAKCYTEISESLIVHYDERVCWISN